MCADAALQIDRIYTKKQHIEVVILQRLLSLIGISYDVAENGKEAFDMMMASNHFDVVHTLVDPQHPVRGWLTNCYAR